MQLIKRVPMPMLSNQPLVSVCLITYNHVRYIAQAIESILAQRTNFKFEILIGEDESSDGTREIVLDYHGRYPEQIKLFLHDRKDVIYVNGKATGRWNFIDTLSRARGKYIAFLEGDDFWTDSLKLQKQVDLMEAHPEYSLCGHWVSCVDDDGKLFSPPFFVISGESCPEVFSVKQALTGTPLHFNSLVFRNFNLLKHPLYPLLLKLPIADCPVMLLLLGNGDGYCLKEKMSAYRVHAGGAWTGKQKYQKEFEMFQFRIAAINFVDRRYLPHVTLIVIDSAAGLIFNVVKECIRSRSVASVRGLLNLFSIQKTMPRYIVLLPLSLAIIYLPVKVILYLRKR